MSRIINKRPMTVGARAVDEYLEDLEKHARARATFRRSLQKLQGDFLRSLATKYTRRTVQKHQLILECFTDYLCDYTDVNSLEEVTKGMVNSGFRSWYKSKVWDSTEAHELRATLSKYFRFLAENKHVRNDKVLAALR
jgi:site-specific recombinase XerD